VLGAVLTLALAVAGAFGAKMAAAFTIAALEEAEAIIYICAGVILAGRWGVHVKIGYLWWEGVRSEGWTAGKRRYLRRLTVAGGLLSLCLIAVGYFFYVHRTGWVQLVVTAALALLVGLLMTETMRLIDNPGGPPRGSDVIEECRPVRWFLRSARYWERLWGVKHAIRFIVDKLPTDHMSRLAMMIVVALLVALAFQGTAVGLRLGGVKDPAPHHKSEGAKGEAAHERVERQQWATDATDPAEIEPTLVTCRRDISPGDGAPEPLKRELRGAWNDIGPAIGCPTRARPTGSGGAYAIYGQCAGRYWSLDVASRRYGAAVLLDPAAEPARAIAASEGLSGASPRRTLGEGDFQLLHTPVGPYVLIRQGKTDGNGGLEGPPDDCAEVKRAKARYSVLPPGIAELWIRFNEEAMRAWPDRDTSWLDDDLTHFTFHNYGGTTVARTFCESAIVCELNARGIHMTSSAAGVRTVTVRRVLEFGPR
jgi:hypothetical protein